ncbi:hypothetical protein [Galbibacter sp. PAP.153]|uniref:hypothetical protein n=1 Tax=Galbibacter sp. PAP.153 TaxID=3104623 RepID=UPI0030087FE7
MKKITIKQAQKLLKEDGVILNEEQTQSVLDFLYDMAEIVVDQYLNTDDSKMSAKK